MIESRTSGNTAIWRAITRLSHPEVCSLHNNSQEKFY